jgi:OmpA-OmpF porin, OOP family
MSSKPKIKTSGKIFLIILAVGAVFAAKEFLLPLLPQKAKASTEIGKIKLPPPEASLAGTATMLPFPKTAVPANNGGAQIEWKIMAWNAQFALMYANGGASTIKGSLMDQAKVQIDLIRQDDCNKSCGDLVKFAKDYKTNPSTPGVFVTFMGDGMPAFFAGLDKELAPLGPDFQTIVFHSMGKSLGEDKVEGPADWKIDAHNAKGKTVACVLRDGDMNILLKWAGDNSSPSNPLLVNPDETTYDPQAINLISANDFLDAPNKYITGYTEKRKLIVNGKKVNQDTTVGVDAFATWTPGDVNVEEAIAKGQCKSVVVIASTKEYSTQMPAVTLTIKKYLRDHGDDVLNIVAALGQAGDQVRSFNEAKEIAAKVSAQVYNDGPGKDYRYWLKYYNGLDTTDKYGQRVHLGGSMAFNLRDAANMFGLGDDHIDRYKIDYETFGNLIKRMYPEILPVTKTLPNGYPDYAKVVDKTFLSSVMSTHPELMEGQALKVQYATTISEKVSSKSYQIQFKSGSFEISPKSISQLNEIFSSAVVAEGLKIGVYGHTDNVGKPESNKTLSRERAKAVQDYLMTKGITADQIESDGYGDEQPIADNATDAGRAKNRRVEIVLGR